MVFSQSGFRPDCRLQSINLLESWDDPAAQAIYVEIWRDAQQGDLDLSLNRYRPLVEVLDQDLLNAFRSLVEQKR